MVEANPCTVYIANELARLYTIITSDEWKFVMLSLGVTRIITYYCSRSKYDEARELAAAAIMFSILVVLIAATEWRAPAAVRQVFACNAPDARTRVAAAVLPPSGPRFSPRTGR